MSDMISGLIRAGYYQAIPDANTDYQILVLTPLGHRTVQSIEQAQLGLAPVNVVSLPARATHALEGQETSRSLTPHASAHHLRSRKRTAGTPAGERIGGRALARRPGA
jgi:hypothetical protein